MRRMDQATQRLVARLYALHLQCRPGSLAQLMGCTPRYIRVLGQKYVDWQLPDDREAVQWLERHKQQRS